MVFPHTKFPVFLAGVSFFVLLLIYDSPRCQVAGFGYGAPSVGMGRVSLFQDGAFSSLNNIANAVASDSLQVGVGFDNRFQMRAFSTFFTGLSTPLLKGGLAVDINRFGDALYNEQRLSLGYAHELGGVRMGARLGYVQFRGEGLPTRGAPVLDIGVVTQVFEHLSIGSYISNILQAKLNSLLDESLPSYLMVGAQYTPILPLALTIQGEKEVEGPARLRAGASYKFLEDFTGRAGISTGPLINYFGLGFSQNWFQVDYAISIHSDLPLSHHFSLDFTFPTGKSRAR